MKRLYFVALVAGLASCSTTERGGNSAAPPAADIMSTYIDIARATYGDALDTARELDAAISQLIANPSEATLQAAREAWRAARIPYQQSEAFRFGNPVVDEWEGRVNAWPLDEGLIDYVAGAYGDESDSNYFYTANIIANPLIDIGGISVDAANITPELLAETLHEIDGVEANVATGYHAIEFLLWGQDLNGTNPGAGERPYTDYSLTNCTHGNCDRRAAYLQAASTLLVHDLEEMTHDWAEGGAAVNDLRAKNLEGQLATIVSGMGSLAYGELANERMRRGLLLHDPEGEHDCFSDNTHWSHYYDALGISNVWHGEYTRVDGSKIDGPSLEDMVRVIDPALHAEMNARLEATQLAMQHIVDAAEAGKPFDVLIASGNTEGEEIINTAVAGLMEQTGTLEKIIGALQLQNVGIEGSTSRPEIQ
jgi:putative iron-regulated protein